MVRASCVVAALLWPILAPLAQLPNDTRQDWIILKAGWAGLDYSQSVSFLARALGLTDWEMFPDLPGARPPGFFLVYAFGLASEQILVLAVALGNALALAYLSKGRPLVAAILLVLLRDSLSVVNPAATWAALIVLTWTHVDDDWRWGIPLGIAATLRLWPLLVVAHLLVSRRRTGLGAGGTFVSITALGLLIVPFSEVVGAMVGGAGWRAITGLNNLSISALLESQGVPLAVTIGLGSVMTLWVAQRVTSGYGVAVIGGVLLSPLGWPEYLAATTPLWGRRLRPSLSLWTRTRNHPTLTEAILPWGAKPTPEEKRVDKSQDSFE